MARASFYTIRAQPTRMPHMRLDVRRRTAQQSQRICRAGGAWLRRFVRANSWNTRPVHEGRRKSHRRLGSRLAATFPRRRQSLKAAGSAVCSHTWGTRPFSSPEQWLQIGGGSAGRRIRISAYQGGSAKIVSEPYYRLQRILIQDVCSFKAWLKSPVPRFSIPL